MSENLIKKAFGKNISSMSILDCTGGLGHDTFILALLGANVTYVEQNKGLTILFEEALRRLPPTKYFIDAVKRITVRQSDSRAFLEQADQYDAIYIDPMFNSKKKLARNKTMTFLDMYLDDHGDELFDQFVSANYKRLVVKKEGRAVSSRKPNLEIKGKSGHGARPHEGVDAIWVASKVISGIQELITRQLDPLDPVVITFGKIFGGNAFNVLAEKVNLIGTVRCTNLKLFKNIGNWLNQNISSIANSCGAQAKVNFKEITPPVNNNSEINEIIKSVSIGKNILSLNKDLTFPTEFGEKAGNGAVVKIIEDELSISIPTLGKSGNHYSSYFIQNKITVKFVIGDRVDTDIIFGNNLNAKTFLVSSGIKNYLDVNIADIQLNKFSDVVPFLTEQS